MLHEFKFFRTQKRGNSIDEYEDSFFPLEIDHDIPIIRVALSDGASEGFFSKIWADILVKNFCRTDLQKFNDYLGQSNKDWKDWKSKYLDERIQHNRSIQWFEEEGIRRGAFATFIGLIVDYKNLKWKAIAIGDSCFFHFQKSSLLRSFPISNSEAFNNRPILLSSENSLTEEIQRAILVESGDFVEGDWFLLMTDALSAWFLHEIEIGDEPFKILEAINTAEEFIQLIETLRDESILNNDDTTLLILR